MPVTKVIACDIYGTILCSDDPENAMPPRRGFDEFALLARSLGVVLVTSSDADTDNLQLDLLASFSARMPFGLEIFDRFFRLDMYPKDYSGIIGAYGLQDWELMVIGDNPIKDLSLVPVRSTSILVPEYNSVNDSFDFSSIDII